ncbi:family 1 glycosylhydrolase [Streptomyces sp. NPDC059690]|uniref:family 1 glycosylhydrolase n=1 Tax=Streptomyces sp. NPDC059690 TaxID=3346907 RepID=UPI003679D81E
MPLTGKAVEQICALIRTCALPPDRNGEVVVDGELNGMARCSRPLPRWSRALRPRGGLRPRRRPRTRRRGRAGTPVLGNCHRTLLDNFEWIFGYGAQPGRYDVDRAPFQRRPKPSAKVYADVVRGHRGAASRTMVRSVPGRACRRSPRGRASAGPRGSRPRFRRPRAP